MTNTTKKDIVKGLMILDNFFRTDFTKKSEDDLDLIVNVWYSKFKEIPSNIFMQAINLTLEETKFINNYLGEVLEKANNIIYGDFKPSEIWNNHIKDFNTMYNCYNQWDDYDYINIRKKFWDTWQSLHPTLKTFFVEPINVVNLIYNDEYYYNQMMNNYIKESLKTFAEFKTNPQLLQYVTTTRKKVVLSDVKKELQLEYTQNLMIGE